MKRIRLRIAYDGTNYHGWQIQKNGVTVEQRLSEALLVLIGEETELIGASRTDAGVHAIGNVAVFDTDSHIPPEKFAIALNHYLPEDIRILHSQEVKSDFHPRHCDSIKTYEYTILAAQTEIPVSSRYSYHVYRPLDIDKMRQVAKMLEGTHDFSAFCSAGSQVADKVRTIYDISINEIPFSERWGDNISGILEGREIRIRVSGSGFLYNMVRIIAGTLIEAGQGSRTADSIRKALESGDRSSVGPTAPARGLMLVGIQYLDERV